MFKLFLILCLFSNPVYANDSVYLEKDQKAPYTGFLMTTEKVKDIKYKLLERDAFEQINKSLQNQVTLYESIDKRNEQKLGLLVEQNDKLAKSLYDERSMTSWERLAWTGLGVILTVLVLYGVQRATNK